MPRLEWPSVEPFIDLKRDLAVSLPNDPANLAELVDTEVRLALVPNAADAAAALKIAKQLDSKFRTVLPQNALDTYRLACQLARRPVTLDEPSPTERVTEAP